LLLHDDPHSVAFIGIATGLSVSAILEFPRVRRAVAIEIVPGVVAVSDSFASANRGVLRDPRVEVVVADGRNHLFGTAESFDVITGDLFFPSEAGTGYLYTAEHFTSVRRRLKPGGIFVQWLQTNQVTVEELRTIVATFTDSFEHSELWLNEIQKIRPLLALVGRASPHSSRPRIDDMHPLIEFSAAANLLSWSSDELRRVLALLSQQGELTRCSS
jgi:spermidine synthase